MIYLEDHDVASVNASGQLMIHHIKHSKDDPNGNLGRAVVTLTMEIQQIMKGNSLMDLVCAQVTQRQLAMPKLWVQLPSSTMFQKLH